MKILTYLALSWLTLTSLSQAKNPTIQAFEREDLREAGVKTFQSTEKDTFSVFVKGFC